MFTLLVYFLVKMLVCESLWCVRCNHVLFFVYSKQSMSDMDMSPVSTPSTPAPRSCGVCRKFLSSRDPHDRCPRCRVPCGDTRCTLCEGLGPAEFERYRLYVQSVSTPVVAGSSGRGPRAGTTSSAAADPLAALGLSGDSVAALLSKLVDSKLAALSQDRPLAVPSPASSVAAGSDAGSTGTAAAAVVTGPSPEPLLPLSVKDRVAMVYDLFEDMPKPLPIPRGIHGSVGSSEVYDETSDKAFPASTLLRGIKPSLEKAFTAASGRGLPLPPPSWRKGSFPVHDLAFPEAGPSAEAHVERLGVRAPPVATVPQGTLQQLDTLARHSMLALSHGDTYLAAAASLVEGSPTDRDQRFYNCLLGLNASLEYVAGASAFVSGTCHFLRRQSYLAASGLDAANQEVLLSQPWSARTLFNNKIPGVLKEQQAAVSADASRHTLDLVGSLHRRLGAAPKRSAPQDAASGRPKGSGPSSSGKKPRSEGSGKGSQQPFRGKKGNWGKPKSSKDGKGPSR
ncbi:uncharacterized protein [Haliotis cracherodii]|uniref:uncharacterized protein n=1 Tax=Haliotis cracherodii TaxID=6455 RepID=UPI0039E8508D